MSIPNHFIEAEKDYFNVYVPINLGNNFARTTVEEDHPAVIEWLYEHAGHLRAYGREWHHPDGPKRYHWSVGGVRFDPQQSYHQFMLSDRRSAQLMKLMFGAR